MKGNLTSTAVAVVVLTITVAIAATLLANVQATQTAGTAAYNVSGFGIAGMLTYGTWIGIIVLVTVAGFIISYLKTSFG